MAEGEVPVEKLSVVDIAITAGCAHRPVRWIGRRTLSCNHHPRPEAVWPVRVSAEAFGEGLPRRDLWLSPDLPADATEIRLHSRSFVPERVRVGAGDGRRLGVPVRGLSVVDGAGVKRLLPIASEALSRGFSVVQGEADRPWRWTTGEAVVPLILWAGTEGGFSLVVELAPQEGALQAWQAPAMATSQDASEVSLEAAAA